MKRSILRSLLSAALIAVGFILARLIPPPVAAQPAPQRVLASAMIRTADAIPTRGDWGEWLRYFRCDTHGTTDMVVLAVTLKPGQAPTRRINTPRRSS